MLSESIPLQPNVLLAMKIDTFTIWTKTELWLKPQNNCSKLGRWLVQTGCSGFTFYIWEVECEPRITNGITSNS